MNRRSILKLAGAGTLSAMLPAAHVEAQGYPSGPITFVVAWPAGGGSDISMRLLADALSRKINVPVVVLNKAGAGGAIGHREIVTAKPDGYTIGMFSSGGMNRYRIVVISEICVSPKPICTSASRSEGSRIDWPRIVIGSVREAMNASQPTSLARPSTPNTATTATGS